MNPQTQTTIKDDLPGATFRAIRKFMQGPTRIYCFCNVGVPEWYDGFAIREDGKVLARHTSSTEEWMPFHLGIGSRNKHDDYAAQCPKGFELVWVHDPASHEALGAVYKLNQQQKTAA